MMQSNNSEQATAVLAFLLACALCPQHLNLFVKQHHEMRHVWDRFRDGDAHQFVCR